MKNDETLMKEYGIESSVKTIYHYKGYRYDNLNDAVNCAKIDANRYQTSLPVSNNKEASTPKLVKG